MGRWQAKRFAEDRFHLITAAREPACRRYLFQPLMRRLSDVRTGDRLIADRAKI
jgi:hypothetical protein